MIPPIDWAEVCRRQAARQLAALAESVAEAQAGDPVDVLARALGEVARARRGRARPSLGAEEIGFVVAAAVRDALAAEQGGQPAGAAALFDARMAGDL